MGCGGVCRKWVGCLYQCLEGWGGVMSVCVRILCVYGRSRYLYTVLGGYLRILGAPSVQSCCTLSTSASNHVFVYGRYSKSRLVCVWLSDLDLMLLYALLG